MQLARITGVVAWLALPIVVGVGLLVFPGKVALNLGALQAMQLLHPFPTAAPAVQAEQKLAALTNLEQSLVHDPQAGQAHLLLARLAAQSADFESALSHYTDRVQLDVSDPVLRYNLPLIIGEWWGLAKRGDPAHELLKVYQAWSIRFPNRAETYLLKSLLLKNNLGDAQGAQNTLQTGAQAGALPLGLLR